MLQKNLTFSSGIVGIDAAKEFFGKFKTLSEADAEWK